MLLSSLPNALLVRQQFRLKRDALDGARRVLTLVMGDDGLQVMAMFFSDGLANRADFVNDWIAPHGSCLRQFFGRTNERRLHARGSTGLLDPATNRRIGDVRTVPRQQIIHAAKNRDRDVERVRGRLRRKDAGGQQPVCEISRLVADEQDRDAIESGESLGRRRCVAPRGLIPDRS